MQLLNRRECLGRTTAAASAAAFTHSLANQVHAAESDAIKVGIVGCGGRGLGAVGHALTTAPNVKLTAMADAYQDKLELGYSSLMRSKAGKSRLAEGDGFGGQIDVPLQRRYVGLDAYRKLIDGDVDVVILTDPPGFRPAHFDYAVKAGKHVFMEKPVATDPSGVRKIIDSAQHAKAMNLKIGVGLQRHHDTNYIEAMRRIHDGEIGRIKSMRCFWNTSAPASRVWIGRGTRPLLGRQLNGADSEGRTPIKPNGTLL